MSKLASVVLLTLAVVVPSWAFNCPVVIKQAEDLVRKAEAGKLSPDTRPLLDEAKKQLAEAKAHHENAKTKRDHGDAVRKAKIAAAFAEEAIVLQTP
ncbi:MAG: hypothetical protein DME11_12370 [Candidatus Rokuibacteriota bacterium]|nr:MAG: hypothetical protein DME11_12370 [Candidatus Rokubacteria bacterium]PYO19323.1 MAG: hypothetical protein DMD88_15545 [Candidatus Rokubacteria bacterium]